MGKGSSLSFYPTVSLLRERIYVCGTHRTVGLSLSLDCAWSGPGGYCTYLEREKEQSCPEYQIFFALAFLEVCSALLSAVIQPQRPLSITFEP